MSTQRLLGIDVGGSGVRCLLVDADGVESHAIDRSWSAAVRRRALGAWDLDLDRLYREIALACRQVLARADAPPGSVSALGISATRFASVVLDRDGAVLLAAPNADGRGGPAALRLGATRGAEIHARTGHWPGAVQPAARLAWLADDDPAASERVAHVLGLGDWLAWRLCGQRATDAATASGTGLFDLDTGRFEGDLAAAWGVPLVGLPRLCASGETLGTLEARAGEALGLQAGTPVVLAGADSQCALVGLGALATGSTGLIAGSTAPIQRVAETAVRDPDARLWSEPHLVPDRFVLESNAGSVGSDLDWFAGILLPGVPRAVGALLAEAEASEVGAGGQFATFPGVRMDARRMELPVGDLSLVALAAPDAGSARCHVARAVAESAAFALRANLEQIEEVLGRGEEAIHLGGGLARSAFFRGLLADVLGRPVRALARAPASALGAALCAARAAGHADGWGPGSPLRGVESTQEPDAERASRYAELHSRWLELQGRRDPALEIVRAHALPRVLAGPATTAPASAGSRPRILVTADLDGASLEVLRGLGEVTHASFRDAMRLLTGRALVEALRGFEVFVTEVDVVDAASLIELPELRVIAACRGDAVNVDVEAARVLGIPVLFAPGRNAHAVADLALAFLLSLARRLGEATAFLRDPAVVAGDMGKMGQAFGTLRGHELSGQTVGLIGFGAVAREVAKRLRPFGSEVLVADPYVAEADALRAGVEKVSIDELLERSHLVSLHAAVTDETRGLISAARLDRMRRGAGLVNTARAALVDEEALEAALSSGRLGGAALDVFSVEPPGADHPLLAHANVIATPHLGGNTHQVPAHQGRIVSADLERLLRGEPPHHVLDRTVLERFDWSKARPDPDRATLESLRDRPAPSVTDLDRDRKKTPGRSAAAAVRLTGAHEAIGERMRAIVAAFAAALGRDEAIARAARERAVTLHFALTDLPIEFHLTLCGEASAGVGPPAEAAEVELRMRARVLDGMFTGTVNAMEEAMSGGLSFSGDAGKAMALQELQRDLSRIYRAARARVGDPGDLGSLPDPSGAAPPPAEHGEEGLKIELCRIVEDLYGQELITATGGNVSARIAGSEDVWITPSQLFKGDLAPGLLVRVGVDGRRRDPNSRSPSSERMMHCAVYQRKREAQAVIHAHAPHATILANAELPFLPISTEAAFFAEIPRVPFIMPGTDELAHAVAEAMGDGWAVLMKNHGLIVAGRTLRRAADMAEIIDRSAQVMLGCWQVGREPPVLPAEAVATLRKMGDLVA